MTNATFRIQNALHWLTPKAASERIAREREAEACAAHVANAAWDIRLDKAGRLLDEALDADGFRALADAMSRKIWIVSPPSPEALASRSKSYFYGETLAGKSFLADMAAACARGPAQLTPAEAAVLAPTAAQRRRLAALAPESSWSHRIPAAKSCPLGFAAISNACHEAGARFVSTSPLLRCCSTAPLLPKDDWLDGFASLSGRFPPASPTEILVCLNILLSAGKMDPMGDGSKGEACVEAFSVWAQRTALAQATSAPARPPAATIRL